MKGPRRGEAREQGEGRDARRRKREATSNEWFKEGQENRRRSLVRPEFLDFCTTFWANLPFCLSFASFPLFLSLYRLALVVHRRSHEPTPFPCLYLAAAALSPAVHSRPPGCLRRTVLGGSTTWRPLLFGASLEKQEKWEGRGTYPLFLPVPFTLPSLRRPLRATLSRTTDRTPDWTQVIRRRAEG